MAQRAEAIVALFCLINMDYPLANIVLIRHFWMDIVSFSATVLHKTAVELTQ